jgi:hypothetical protein
MVRMRGVTTMGVDWASGEASDLVEPPGPAKSSTIHAFENIRVYIEYSHCQFRIYGLNASLWYFEEL